MNKKHIFMLLSIPLAVFLLFAQNPSWYNDVNVLAFKGTPKTPVNGGTWGFSVHTADERLYLQGQAEYFHSLGQFYHSSIQFYNTDWFKVKTKRTHACVNIKGKPIKESGKFIANLHSPKWKQEIEKYLKQIVDAGADGVIIDGYFPNINNFLIYGASFDKYTMEHFRDYLNSKFTAQQLKNRFDIEDINTFDFADWIKQYNLEASWNQIPLEELPAEFYRSEWLYAKTFLADFMAFSKDYAQKTKSKDFVISQNNAGYFYASADIDDFLIGEYFYYHPGGASPDMAASQVKVGKAIGDKPVLILAEICELPGLYDLPLYSTNMIKLIFADIYASGGQTLLADFIPHIKNPATPKSKYVTPYTYDTDVSTRYALFIQNNQHLYANLTSFADVALVYSFPSLFNRDIKVEEWHDRLEFGANYMGMSKLLIRENVQHDVVFFPDNFLIKDNVSYKKLKEYKCLIVPNVYSMTKKQAKVLLKYVKKGGTVVAAGYIGTHDEDGRLASRKKLKSLTTEGTHSYRKGTFVYFEEEIGRNYLDFEYPNDQKLIATEIEKYSSIVTRVYPNNIATVYAYRNMANSKHILHVVNYNFEPNVDQFTVLNNLRIQIIVPSGQYTAKAYSPDFTGPQNLATSWSSGNLEIKVPELEAYQVIVVEKTN